MNFLRKFLLLNVIISPPSYLTYRYLSSEINNPTKDEILTVYNKNLSQNMSLSSEVDANVGTSKNKFVYSLFSTNLTTFTNLLNNYFYQWFLFKWGDELLQENSDAFLESKIKIFNEFKRHNISYNYNLKTLNPTNWKRENSVIYNSYNALKTEFERIFFEKIFLKNGNNDSSVNFDVDTEEEKKGGKDYKKIVSEFQGFIYKEWLNEEKPFLTCSYDFPYSSGKPNIFADDNGEENQNKLKIPEKANFSFPHFGEENEKWENFINLIKGNEQKSNIQNDKKLCNNSKIQLYKLSSLLKIEDGYKLSAIIHNNELKTENKKTEKKNLINETLNEKIEESKHKKNPLHFFIKIQKHEEKEKEKEKKKEEQDNEKRILMWKINEKVFKPNGDNADFKSHKFATHISDIEIKENVNRKKREGEQTNDKKYGTITRTQDGITFLYQKNEHKDVENFFKKEEKTRETNNKSKTIFKFPKLTEELKNYFNTKPSQLIIKYLNSNPGSKLLKNSGAFSKYDIFINAVKYWEELEKNKKYSQFISIFSKTVIPYSEFSMIKNEEEKDNKNTYIPTTEAGLSVPLMFKKNLNNTSTDRYIYLLDYYGIYSEIDDKSYEYSNDGNIPELTLNTFGKPQKTQLHKYAGNLKRSIAKWEYFKNVEKSTKLDTYFFNDYIFDNIFYDMKYKKNELFQKTMKNIILMNDASFDLFINDIYHFSRKLSNGISNKDDSERLTALVKEYIVEEYYGKKYLNESKATRINYGGYEYKNFKDESKNKPEETEASQKQNCIQKTKWENGKIIDVIDKDSEKGTCENFLNKTKESWNIKLKNYWTEKNYFLSDNGYEITSAETDDYIEFLHSLSWSLRQNFKNIKNFFRNQISQGKFGVFLWINEISDASWNEKKEQNKEEETTTSRYIGTTEKENGSPKPEIITLKDKEKYFQEIVFNDFIFNPFFSTEFKPEMIEKSDFPSTVDYSKAYAKISDSNEDKYTEFSGFKGFVTDIFNKESLDNSVFSAIFKNFKNANPENNKSFNKYKNDQKSDKSENNIKQQYGTYFGNIFVDTEGSIEKKINSIKTVVEIRKYIEQLPPEIKKEYTDDIDVNESNIDLLKNKKNKLIKAFKEKIKNNPQFSRFSGYIQNPDGDNEIYGQKYFIPKEKSSNSGYIVYITQLRRSDFSEKSNDLFKEVSYRTFLKSVFIASEMKDLQKISIGDAIAKAEFFM